MEQCRKIEQPDNDVQWRACGEKFSSGRTPPILIVVGRPFALRPYVRRQGNEEA
jgi:hypothetical protein